jgi:predicted O-methyltransferase YrrM
MDHAVKTVLHELEARVEAEAERIREMEWTEFVKHRDEMLLAVGPATGQFLNLLVKEAGAKTILEIGTSYGYSTVWLAEAARTTGGKVITLEFHGYKQEHAQREILRAGLGDFVEFRLGDARESLTALETPVDFVLLDLWKDLYIPCFDLFYPKLAPGALIVADNMLTPDSARPEAKKYRSHLRAKADLQSVLLPVGNGLEVSRFTRGLDRDLV